MSKVIATEDNTDRDEFERERVPEGKLQSAKSFWGMYASEHTAGTEFMIGPLFLAAGVSAFDLILGLLLGNLLAVLSWVFICGPLAVKTRHTLYFQLERVAGRKFVLVYNLANGLLFCFLAGAMITVSATAVGIPFDIKMPALDDSYPTGLSWILVVFAIGAVISVVASKGYRAVAKFGTIAAPWMIVVFIACGLTALPKLGVTSLGEFWTVATERIWTGGEPVAGQLKFTFWHVMFFSWFCNAAMHVGMADMSVLRFAKKKSYAWATSGGMYLGHFVAWIAASLLYAVQLNADPTNTGVLPGPMANDAIGLAGLICVVIAGWTTANPTIYRAGLAFQALMPKSHRTTVTLAAGAVATIAGLFPAFAMKLLGFVGIYGTILAPVGAILFFDYFFKPKFKLESIDYLTSERSLNPAAVAAWAVSLAVCYYFWHSGVFASFLILPAWILCGVLFLAFSKGLQK